MQYFNQKSAIGSLQSAKFGIVVNEWFTGFVRQESAIGKTNRNGISPHGMLTYPVPRKGCLWRNSGNISYCGMTFSPRYIKRIKSTIVEIISMS